MMQRNRKKPKVLTPKISFFGWTILSSANVSDFCLFLTAVVNFLECRYQITGIEAKMYQKFDPISDSGERNPAVYHVPAYRKSGERIGTAIERTRKRIGKEYPLPDGQIVPWLFTGLTE